MTIDSPQSNILFVFGDGRKGHALVKSLCAYNEKVKRVFNSMIAVVDKKFEQHMEDLRDCKSCTIESLHMQKIKENPQEFERIIQEHKANWIVMLPAGDTFSAHCVKTAADVWKKTVGNNVILLSVAKCDSLQKAPLSDLVQTEKEIQQLFPKANVILRTQIVLEDLDFFLSSVKRNKTWRLPTGDGVFAPVSLMKDVASSIGYIAMDNQLSDRCADQTFTLTNSDKVNGNRLAELTRTTFNEDVKFQNLPLEEANKILKEFEHGGQKGGEDERCAPAGQGQACEGKGGKGCTHLYRHLISSTERNGLLQMFQLIQKGEYDMVTDDVKKITGSDPVSIEDYLHYREDHLMSRQ